MQEVQGSSLRLSLLRGNILMSRKRPSLVQLLLNLVFSNLPEQTRALSNQFVAYSQQPLTADCDAWYAYWQEQGQPWRTEPEIDAKRQECLTNRRTLVPNIEEGKYPFKDMKLSRADVEWLLATLDGHGPVDWSDNSQRKRTGLDLRGADLRHVNLQELPLTRLCGGLTKREQEWATEDQCAMARAHMEGTVLAKAQLQGADLHHVYLEGANLSGAQLESADLTDARLRSANLFSARLQQADLSRVRLQEGSLYRAQLQGATLRKARLEKVDLYRAQLEDADLRETQLEGAYLRNVTLTSQERTGPFLADVQWTNVNLAIVSWSQGMILGDEQEARKKKTNGKEKSKEQQFTECESAVRANRQLAAALQTQGLNEEAVFFSYHAQLLQRRVFGLQVLQPGVKLRQRSEALAAWLFSWFLFLLAGYGYRLWHSFLAYMLVVIGFTMTYYFLGTSDLPPLSLVNALGLSMTSLHGRGFFPGATQLNDTLTVLASIEAFVGLILEATFIATLTQRFFGK